MFITQQVKPLSKHHRINEKKQLKERKTIDLHKKIEKEDVILMAHRAFLKNTQQIFGEDSNIPYCSLCGLI